jgi:DNA-binding transcriptional LysR family regulator
MFQLRHLRTFVAAAETLSFTRAAERVHLAQPSVTEQIRALEDVVGRPLFLRRHNTLSLTAAGHALLPRARELLAMADDALNAVQGDGEAASLALAAPEALATGVLAPLVADHAGRHPGLRVALRSCNSAETLADVKSGAAGLGLLHGVPLADESLSCEVITRDHAVVAMWSSDPLAQRPRITLADLAGVRLGATTVGCSYRTYLDGVRQGAGLSIAFEASSVGALLALVASGMGVCVVPRLAFLGAAPGLRSELVVRAVADAPPLPVCLVLRAAPPHSAGEFARVLRANARSLDEAVSALDV